MIVSPSAYRAVACCLCTVYNHVYHSGAGNYRESDVWGEDLKIRVKQQGLFHTVCSLFMYLFILTEQDSSLVRDG